MIVRNLNQSRGSRRLVETEGWNSVRLLLKDDGMGFSFHITTIYEGADLPMHYKNHLESVYCISGEGSIEDLETGELVSLNDHPVLDAGGARLGSPGVGADPVRAARLASVGLHERAGADRRQRAGAAP